MDATALINTIVKNGESGITLWLMRDEIKDFIEKQDEKITELTTRAEELRTLKSKLKEIEYVEQCGLGMSCCPVCDASPNEKHTDSCWLANAL